MSKRPTKTRWNVIRFLLVWGLVAALLAWQNYASQRRLFGAFSGAYLLEYHRLPDGRIEWGPPPELGEPTWKIETTTRVFCVQLGVYPLADEIYVYRGRPIGPEPLPTEVFLRHAAQMDADARARTSAEPGGRGLEWQDEHQFAAKSGTASRVHWHWSGACRWLAFNASVGLIISSGLLFAVRVLGWIVTDFREDLAAMPPPVLRTDICQHCGYSRLGLPDQSPCPECGQRPITNAAAVAPGSSPDPSPVATHAGPR